MKESEAPKYDMAKYLLTSRIIGTATNGSLFTLPRQDPICDTLLRLLITTVVQMLHRRFSIHSFSITSGTRLIENLPILPRHHTCSYESWSLHRGLLHYLTATCGSIRCGDNISMRRGRGHDWS